LVVNANDDVIVTGQRATNGPGTTMKHGIGGQVSWRVEEPSFTPNAIAQGPANSVYVAGTTATGIVVQMIIDDPAPASIAAVPATGRAPASALVAPVLPARRWRAGNS
jgi:hypothetical protein